MHFQLVLQLPEMNQDEHEPFFVSKMAQLLRTGILGLKRRKTFPHPEVFNNLFDVLPFKHGIRYIHTAVVKYYHASV